MPSIRREDIGRSRDGLSTLHMSASSRCVNGRWSCINLVLVSLLVALCAPATGGNDRRPDSTSHSPLVSYAGVGVTLDDTVQYVRSRVAPEVYESALSKPGAVFQSIGNLYILRRAASLAMNLELVSESQLAYIAQDARDRDAVEKYVARETEQRLADVDWNALAREQYLVDQDKYEDVDEVKASHILIKAEERNFFELADRVSEVAAQLDTGRAFHEVALEYSEDASVETNSGSLGFFGRGRMDPAFEQAAFAMHDVGSVSEPVLSSFGVHFILYEGRRSLPGVEFADVKGKLIKELKRRRQIASRNLILEPLRSDIQPALSELDEEALARQIYAILTGDPD